VPSKPRKVCSKPGCNALGSGAYCDTHAAEAEQRRQRLLSLRRGSSSSRGYDSRWQKLRLYKLARNPLCERCESLGRIERASLVHHIKPINDGGAVLDMDNLMSVCEVCHDKLHSCKG
jgi:5-methylcytosine-specific restriction protein A